MMGFSDSEACAYTELCPASLYNYQKEHPEFLEQKELWKQNPILKAKKIIIDDLDNGEIDTARWYLERKCKDEFSTKQEVDNHVDISQVPTEELLRLAEEAMAKLKEPKE